MSRPSRSAGAIALAIALVSCAPVGAPERDGRPRDTAETSSSPRPGARDRARVVRVVDGDTLVVERDGATVRVRLIGVDTPESVKPGSPVECYGREAAAELRRLVDGHEVVLEYDVERRDRYGRTLAYVYRVSDDAFVNRLLVERGAAVLLTIPPNVAHVDAFVAAQRRARAARAGLWRACVR